MRIRERKHIKCGECGKNKLVRREVYGCDNCQKEIGLHKNQSYLRLTVFFHNSEAEDMQFCSWVCVLQKMQTIKTDYFIDLPMLTFDNEKVDGCNAADFWKAVKALC